MFITKLLYHKFIFSIRKRSAGTKAFAADRFFHRVGIRLFSQTENQVTGAGLNRHKSL
ncbi:hypothetical protein D2M30_1976 [Bacillus amyloliquefaciens]|nr:hypothetical protein D2M30_1976 [Bacillus amyloliquefaciens]